jgi:sugar O-acyltransferase (sialic acid O-acetyltransferase NeuD family)
MKTLGIIGSGILGLQIAHYAITDKHYDKVVFIDDFAVEKEKSGYPIIGNSNDVEKLYKQGYFDELIIGIGYKHLKVRKELYEKFSDSIPFGKIIHSSCWVDSTSVVEEGCFIYPCGVIDANVVIKANTILNLNCTIAHDTVIGSHSFLSPRIAIAGFVTIGELCFLGINAAIIDNINIKSQTQIGGGAVVIQSIEKSGLYLGNPAKFIR